MQHKFPVMIKAASYLALAVLSLAQASCSASESARKVMADTVRPDLPDAQEFAIWPGIAPGSEGWSQHENDISILNTHVVYNIVRPTLIAYFPDRKSATGLAMIIAPGGGFRFLQIDNEGTAVARWLAAHGIAAFVLKYRTEPMPDSSPGFLFAVTKFLRQLQVLTDRGAKGEIALAGGPDTTHAIVPENPLDWPFYGAADGIEAMTLVRMHAAKWNIDPNRIGFMGFSAGSMVTYGVIAGADAADMPNFAAPLYYSLSPSVPIPANAPPLFLGAASDDPISRGMPQTYTRWIAAGHSAELHMWAKGGHGFGMSKQNLPVDHWIECFYAWLGEEGFLTKK